MNDPRVIAASTAQNVRVRTVSRRFRPGSEAAKAAGRSPGAPEPSARARAAGGRFPDHQHRRPGHRKRRDSDDHGRLPPRHRREQGGDDRGHDETADVVAGPRDARHPAPDVREPGRDQAPGGQNGQPREGGELKEAQRIPVPQLGHQGTQTEAETEHREREREHRPRAEAVHGPPEERRRESADRREGERCADLGAGPAEGLLDRHDEQPERVLRHPDRDGGRGEDDGDDERSAHGPVSGGMAPGEGGAMLHHGRVGGLSRTAVAARPKPRWELGARAVRIRTRRPDREARGGGAARGRS